ncbi:MAG: Helix-turn-helix domain [Chloroflexota bacterium]|jgi:transcriptional regulator with XRE-family HTH domain|nr:Helix-turn-helix domain [Chloroflexota bacterium]
MNDTQLGALFRAVRIHLRMRQEDVARLARVSQSSVSRIERGHQATLPAVIVRTVASVLEIRLDTVPSWRGGDLERVVNARHSALHELLAERLARVDAWQSAAEVSYSIFGERGVIDRLSFHAERRMLAVFEIKADLADPAGLVSQVDRYRRLAPNIARDRGWHAGAVSCWAVIADTDTNRRRLAAHESLLRGAFPAAGRSLGAWLRDPVDRVDGLTFVASRGGTGARSLSAVKRVRPTRPRS